MVSGNFLRVSHNHSLWEPTNFVTSPCRAFAQPTI